jgi:hypothetical protein
MPEEVKVEVALVVDVVADHAIHVLVLRRVPAGDADGWDRVGG